MMFGIELIRGDDRRVRSYNIEVCKNSSNKRQICEEKNQDLPSDRSRVEARRRAKAGRWSRRMWEESRDIAEKINYKRMKKRISY